MKGKKCRSIFLKIKKVAKGPPQRKKKGGGLPCHFGVRIRHCAQKKKKKVAVTDFK
jgi:hypothetical protein